MTLVRAFTLQAFQFNVLVHAWHVPGLENRIADALSCQQMDLFRELDPGAKEFPKMLGNWRSGKLPRGCIKSDRFDPGSKDQKGLCGHEHEVSGVSAPVEHLHQFIVHLNRKGLAPGTIQGLSLIHI